jgi:hypothetical protein
MESKMIAVAAGIIKLMEQKNLNHIIVFASTIKRSKIFKQVMDAVSSLMDFDADCFHIDHTHSETERKKLISKFKNSKHSILTNAKLLGEGFDMPAVDGVTFLDEKHSVSSIVQCAGRAWRTDPNKNKLFGFILVPTIFDSNFDIKKPSLLTNVISALAVNDERIFRYFERGSIFRKKEADCILEKPFFLNIDNCPISFDLTAFTRFITVKVWEDIKSVLNESSKTNWMNPKECIKFVRTLAQFGVKSCYGFEKYYRCSRTNPEKISLRYPGATIAPPNLPRYPWKHYPELTIEELFPKQEKNVSAAPLECLSFILSLRSFGVTTRELFEMYCRDQSKFPGAPIKPLEIPENPWDVYTGYDSFLFFQESVNQDLQP